MDEYTFGNLMEWGGVMEKMETLAKSGKIGDHQDELIRVLRYNENWRLRETALQILPKIQTPSPSLINEVLKIMLRDDLYYDLRILAADALGKALKGGAKALKRGKSGTEETIGRVLDGMHHLLDEPQPPILHKAVRASMDNIVNG